MKQALISPSEVWVDAHGVQGARVAQVEATAFLVAAPLFWVECPDECVADAWFYVDGAVAPYVPPPVPE